MDQEEEEFLEFVNVVEDAFTRRMPKRYLRDMENPLERYHEDEFRQRYRFGKNAIKITILPLILNKISKINNRGLPFPPIIQLLVCLRFYATGNFQTVSGDLRGVSQQSVSKIIKTISILLAQHLKRYVYFPKTEMEQRKNISRFAGISGFPGISACVDCTHIAIANPGGDNAEVFRNRKGYFSLNVQVAAGPRMEILDIVVRHPGSTHDSVIFDRSSLRVRFENNQVLGKILGDNGYPCRPYLLTPVIHPGMLNILEFVESNEKIDIIANPHELRYNTAHILTRNTVERGFGVWKRKFPCLRRVLATKINTSLAIICATAVLYNIGIQQNEYMEVENDFMPDNLPVINTENNQLGLLYRNQFIHQHF